MPLVENMPVDSRILALFVGRSGSGKSAAAYSFPKPAKIFDLDGRVRGGLVPWVDKKGLEYQYFPPMSEKMVFEQLNNAFAILHQQCKAGQAPYETIILDSATWASNALLLDALPYTHTATGAGDKGKKIGSMNIAGPSDWLFQSNGMTQIIAYLRSLPIKNILVTAHIVNRWGKLKDADGKVIDPYGQSEIVGEKLTLTDKIAEELPGSFDHIFRFEKTDTGAKLKFTVSGQGELARTPCPIPYGEHDITGKSFYEFLQQKINATTTTK